MNSEYEHTNLNRYEGNGWSKYQLMVLQQLDDHNTVLQNLNKEIASIKQFLAVQETEIKMWKMQVTAEIVELQKDVDHVLYDEKGINQRLYAIERTTEVEEKSSNKTKAVWALYGSVAVFLVDFLMRALTLYFKK